MRGRESSLGPAVSLLVGLGGGLGAVTRVAMGETLTTLLGVQGYLTILAVNTLGCTGMGLLFVILELILRQDGASRLAGTHVARTFGHLPAFIAPDPTQEGVDYFRANRRLRLTSGFLLTGFLGGFTTFSAYGLYTVTLAEEEHWPGLLVNLGGSVLLGLGGTAIGMLLGARLLHRRPVR